MSRSAREADQARHRAELGVLAEINADYAKTWPNITVKREPPADAKDFDGKPDKLAAYFSDKPGEGD